MLGRFFLSFTVLVALGHVLSEYVPSKAVNEILSDMAASINTSVDPCNDFYEYACGNWHVNNPIPSSARTYSVATKSQVKTNQRLRDILSKAVDNPDDAELINLTKAYFRSCMNQEAIEARGLQPILEILRKNGGWPLITEDVSNLTETWQSIHANYTRLYNTGAFFNIKMHPGAFNYSRTEIRIDLKIKYPLMNAKSTIDLNETNPLYESVVKDIMYNFVEESGSQVTEKVLVAISDLLAFQRKLHFAKQLSPTPPEVSIDDRMPIKLLQKYYDNNETPVPQAHIDFLSQIKTIYAEIGEKINEYTMIDVHNKHHLLELKKVLKAASPRNILNYVHWNMVTNLLPYTTQKMRTLIYKVQNDFDKPTHEKDRWEACIDELQLERGLSFAFAKGYANESVIDTINDMASKIRDQIKRRISQSQNFDAAGKTFLTKKLDGLKLFIGYPKWYNNGSFVKELYDGFTVGPNYFDNVVNLRLFKRKKSVQAYENPPAKYSSFLFATTETASHNGFVNSIEFPLASFIDDFPDISVPDFLAYARVGTILGHEMTHAITGDGWIYDEEGNWLVVPVDGTTQEGIRNLQCFASEYSKYVLRDTGVTNETVYLDGDLTIMENLADALGVQAAYDAYLAAMQEINHQTPVQLPHALSNFTNQQLFFISRASLSCRSVRPEIKYKELNVDVHSPGKYRVIGSLAHSSGFASAFGCPLNSTLNPTKKCQVV